MSLDLDTAEQFEKLLNSPKQTWLLGAGVSFNSNIPLMVPLTNRVLSHAREVVFAEDAEALELLDFVENDIEAGANIEVFLTHLADLISISERSRTHTISIGKTNIAKPVLTQIHVTLLSIIADTIRWGFRPEILDENEEVIAEEQVGQPGKSIVEIDEHEAFVRAIFGTSRAGLERLRSSVELFTTNYDTLIEDALALNLVEYSDGFVGSGVGFWNPASYQNVPARVTKLHGSIDWFRSSVSPSPLLRIRHGDTYPSAGGSVMIYPQAAKYMNAQIDPFSALFSRFRARLADGVDQVLLVCGYSFGDEHINADIEIAMATANNQLAMIAFVRDGDDGLPTKLETWRQQSSWKDRVYIASSKGLYRGSEGPTFTQEGQDRLWWTFKGVTDLIANGLPTDIQEALQ